MDRSSKQKNNKALNETLDLMYLIDIYKAFQRWRMHITKYTGTILLNRQHAESRQAIVNLKN